jgi:hypothetical protein
VTVLVALGGPPVRDAGGLTGRLIASSHACSLAAAEPVRAGGCPDAAVIAAVPAHEGPAIVCAGRSQPARHAHRARLRGVPQADRLPQARAAQPSITKIRVLWRGCQKGDHAPYSACRTGPTASYW